MPDPTPTPQTPPQGLTDKQLNAVINQAYEDSRSLVQAQSGLLSLDRFIARAAIAAHEAARPQLTPEEVEARFRSWIQKETGLIPSKTATTYAAAFALRLLAGEVAA